jgi:CubicO group peptidase (beta-lactamase class C family)
MNLGDAFDPAVYDSRASHAAELPASGGIGNARGLAGLYQPLACRGMTRGRRIIGEESLTEMSSVASAGTDAVTLIPSRYSAGFQKRMDNRRQQPGDRASLLLPETAFGHAGFGGSIGFADPAAELSFAFVTNRGVTGGFIDARAESLIAAAYASLEKS